MENEGFTFIDASIVGGNLGVLGNSGNLEIEFNQVGGSLNIRGNFVPASASVIFNQVGGSLDVYETTGPAFKQVVANTAGEVVACQDNDPPFIGGPNTAPNTEGQCF